MGDLTKIGDIMGAAGIDFSKRVKFADECVPCELCGEPWCVECNDHYADCSCPGPHSEPEEEEGAPGEEEEKEAQP